MRAFTDRERKNQEFLVSKGIEFSVFQITETGLRKSILDATAPMRTYLVEQGIHDYSTQGKGPINKKKISSIILTEYLSVETETSLYRPETKDGDPRFWVYELKNFTDPDDIHAIIAKEGVLYIINLTRIDLSQVCSALQTTSPIFEFVEGYCRNSSSVSSELLEKLMNYERTWINTNINADTAIGRQVESLLGIPMNASPVADYKGIELKSFRSNRPNVRKTLFCKVPDWDISALRSASQIVDKYGYITANGKSYRNTVCCREPNSQRLRLNVNYEQNLLELEESILRGTAYSKKEDVAVWRLTTLHDCLLNKHRETFWIEVDTRIVDGCEQFRFKKIEHTKNPVVSQFDILLEQSLITVDLLLGRTKVDATGKRKSGGDCVSFKLKKGASGLLFPESEEYIFSC